MHAAVAGGAAGPQQSRGHLTPLRTRHTFFVSRDSRCPGPPCAAMAARKTDRGRRVRWSNTAAGKDRARSCGGYARCAPAGSACMIVDRPLLGGARHGSFPSPAAETPRSVEPGSIEIVAACLCPRVSLSDWPFPETVHRTTTVKKRTPEPHIPHRAGRRAASAA
jgi:hypothetical protein